MGGLVAWDGLTDLNADSRPAPHCSGPPGTPDDCLRIREARQADKLEAAIGLGLAAVGVLLCSTGAARRRSEG